MISIEEQLANTQHELEQIKAEYKEFAYIVSHDLSGPFRTTSGVLKIILENKDSALDEKTKRHLKIVLNETQKGSEILTSLLDYSRINTQAEPCQVVDSAVLVADVLTQLADLIGASNAHIKISALPSIYADKKQLSLVFYHMLKNSLTYIRDDVQTRIELSAKDKNGAVEFAIKDNGIGIRETHIDKIFKVLRRGVTQGKYPGNGLGLALAKKVVQRHNGNIRVESNVETGTTFYFTLAAHNQDNR